MSSHLREIERHLNTLRLRDNLTPLFCETLSWGRPAGVQRQLPVGAPVSRAVTVAPVAQLAGLPVFRVDWEADQLPNVAQRRAVHKALAPTAVEHLLCYVTQDGKQAAFVRARQWGVNKIELRTLPYQVGSAARTTIERLGALVFSLDELAVPGQPSIAAVTDKLDKAFDVEAVTKQFFEGYGRVFADLRKRLSSHTDDEAWAHDYALQTLSRLLFLCFIQRKRWLDGDPEFIRSFWQAYKRSGQPTDTFFEKWLSVLFFEAFNEKFQAGRSDRQYFPDDVRAALALAPYLNGGLFARNGLDAKHQVAIADGFFGSLFDHFEGSSPGFLERYNITVAESTPFDVEVAVDPEVIGKVYESLVNLTSEGLTEEDLRGAAGIFYTPRVEIDLMCRLSLVDHLANHLGEQRKPLLYNAVLAYDTQEKDGADEALMRENLWGELSRLLREVTVCDPACGSGSFLVGMLLVLDDLQARASAQLGVEETPHERRRRIIGQSLYGVDVMDWAVHVAELRLWLQLAVETELKPAELKFRPLLPNLSFKVRQGDSLVQEIGGINFGLHRDHLDIPTHLKGRLTELKGRKLHFYHGEAKGLSEEAIRHEEVRLFRDVLAEKRHALEEEVKRLTRDIDSPPDQLSLAGMERKEPEQVKRVEAWRQQRSEKAAELERIQAATDAIKTATDLPFVWDVAFVEIFEGDRKGFDVVIGNPPYVRQEKIAPPLLREQDYAAEQWRRLKAEYKARLQDSVVAAYPRFFRGRRPDGKSDLYVYFYLHGLSLVNEKGSFCFITSNSWLDVGYGKDLQEFLLKHSHVKLVLDNEARRSFAQADVNTIIALLAPPDDRRAQGSAKTGRFVTFKVPFEDASSPVVFQEIEEATERLTRQEFRVCAVSQRLLYEEGLAASQDEDEGPHSRRVLVKTATYEGNKWGGKYLRAPDILFTILQKGKGKLVRLGDIAEVRRGFTTGANEFFYLDHAKVAEWGIEADFLKPVIKSPRECRRIVVRPEDLKFRVFMCHKDKAELRGTNALEYVKWGESQGFHERPTCRGRQRWWDLADRRIAPICFNKGPWDRHFIPVNNIGAFTDQQVYIAFPHSDVDVEVLKAVANCTMCGGFLETIGRSNFGEGILWIAVYEAAQMPILGPSSLASSQREQLLSAFANIAYRDIRNVFQEIHQADRRALDEVVFEVLGLTAGEREAVYEAVVELVRKRLEKARSA